MGKPFKEISNTCKGPKDSFNTYLHKESLPSSTEKGSVAAVKDVVVAVEASELTDASETVL